ncbi:MAG TPA: AmmeMemoRadiSam system protein A [Chloroflexi bacterium]|nr:AmmeMemoRadiSam system protein A [Chloroflexota bacterium]
MVEALLLEERAYLLRCAREAIARRLQRAPQPMLPDEGLTPRLRAPGASFVTLTLAGELRGCIGSLTPRRPLALDVRENAVAAAFEDPRFLPLTPAEFEQLHIEISVLTPHEPLDYTDANDLLQKLRPGVDGVVLEQGWHRATFLPQVWEQLPDPRDFLGHLCRKAQLPPHAWQRGDVDISTYQVEKFGE